MILDKMKIVKDNNSFLWFNIFVQQGQVLFQFVRGIGKAEFADCLCQRQIDLRQGVGKIFLETRADIVALGKLNPCCSGLVFFRKAKYRAGLAVTGSGAYQNQRIFYRLPEQAVQPRTFKMEESAAVMVRFMLGFHTFLYMLRPVNSFSRSRKPLTSSESSCVSPPFFIIPAASSRRRCSPMRLRSSSREKGFTM